MKVKTLLKTLKNTDYVLMDANGNCLDKDFVGDKYYGESVRFEDEKVISIHTVMSCDTLFITIE